MATRDDINKRWQTARAAFKGTDADFLATEQGKGISGELGQYYSTLTDPGEIASELAYQSGRTGDEAYGTSARGYEATLRARQSQVPGVPGAGPAYSPGPQASGAAPAAPSIPQNQMFTPKDDSVEGALTSLTAKDTPLMQQARTRGLASANKRGLAFSSTAIGAAESEAYKAAVPLAVQQASQASQYNVAGMQDAGAMQRLIQQLGSQEKVAFAEQAAAKERLGMQLSSQEQVAANELKAAIQRLKISETGADTRTNKTIASNEALAANNITAGQQTAAATAISGARATLTNRLNTISNNENIPYEERQTMIQQANADFQADVRAYNTLFGTNITW